MRTSDVLVPVPAWTTDVEIGVITSVVMTIVITTRDVTHIAAVGFIKPSLVDKWISARIVKLT